MNEPVKNNPQVVVIGAGFGGLRVAQGLAKAPVEVTLIDRNNYHLFQPLLYQVATSALSTDAITYPIRSIFRGQKNLRYHMGEVQAVDLDRKVVVNGMGEIPYDLLVVAVGGETNYYGLKTVEENAFGLKDLDDAASLRNHLLALFEKAARERDAARRKAMLTFLVAGGGPTGVECAGALSELIGQVLSQDYPEVDFNEVRIVLIEAAGSLLATMPKHLGVFAAKILEKKHVELRFNTTLAGYDGSRADLKSGEGIDACTLVWAAGVRALSLLDGLGLDQDRAGRVKVDATLQAQGRPGVFVIGDAACALDENGVPLPMVAPVAIQAGVATAKNIIHLVKGEPLDSFEYHDPGILATIGKSQAVAKIGRWELKGLVAWLVWVVVHIYQLIGFRNRAAVMMDWAWNYLFHERAVRLIGPESDPFAQKPSSVDEDSRAPV